MKSNICHTTGLFMRLSIVLVVVSTAPFTLPTRASDKVQALLDEVEAQQDERRLGRPYHAELARLFDTIEKDLEEWGYASMSELTLIEDIAVDGRHRFDLNYTKPTEDYIDRARTNLQGAAALFTERSTDLTTEITAQNDQLVKLQNEVQRLELLNEIKKQRKALTEEEDNKTPGPSTEDPPSPPTQATPPEVSPKLPKEQILGLVEALLTKKDANGTAEEPPSSNPFNTDEAKAQLMDLLDAILTSEEPSQESTGTGTEASPSPPAEEESEDSAQTPEASPSNEQEDSDSSDAAGEATPASASPDAKEVLSKDKFLGFQELIGSKKEFQPSEADVLKIGTSHKVSELLLSFMTAPQLPRNRQAFLAISQIGVSPGWRTREGYICEIHAGLELATGPDEIRQAFERKYVSSGKYPSLKFCGRDAAQKEMRDAATFLKEYDWSRFAAGASQFDHVCDYRVNGVAKPTPVYVEDLIKVSDLTVLSAFPFAESQSLDLRNSLRTQLSILQNIAATYKDVGLSLSAKQINSFVRRIQQDVATRTFLPVVVPNTTNSEIVYRFDPSLTALKEPEDKRSKAGRILHASSIPVLIVIIGDHDLQDHWSKFSISFETRWISSEKRHWANRGFVDWWRHGHIKGRSQSNYSRLRNISYLDSVWELADALNEKNYLEATLDKRIRQFQSILRPLPRFFPLPVKRPSITALLPSSLAELKNDTQFEVVGANFGSDGQEVKQVRLGNIPLKILQDSDRSKLHLKFENSYDVSRMKPGKYDLEAILSDGTTKLSNAFTLTGFPPPTLDASFPKTVVEGTLDVEFHVIGENFVPTPDDQILAATVGGKPLSIVVNKLKDNYLLAKLPKTTLKPGEHDLEVFSPTGHAKLPKALKVTAAPKPKPAIPQKVDLDVSAITPERGFVHSESLFAIIGEGFMSGGKPTIKKVIIAGRSCEFEVVSEFSLIAKVPKWSDATQLNQFNDKNNKASVVVVSHWETDTLDDKVYFDVTLPRPAPKKPTSDPVLTQRQKELKPLLDGYLKGIKNLSETNQVQASLSLELDAGLPKIQRPTDPKKGKTPQKKAHSSQD